MNWFLLLLILKCLHATWAAPIDYGDITTEGLSEANTANNLFESMENTTLKVQQEENSSATTTQQSIEVNTESEFPNFGIQSSYTTENLPTETNFSSENVSQESLASFQTSEPSENAKNDFTLTSETSTNIDLESQVDKSGIPPTTTAPETEDSTLLSKADSLEENTAQELQNHTEILVENGSEIKAEAVTEPPTQSSTQEIIENLYQDLQNQSEKLLGNLINKEAEQSLTDSPKTLTPTSILNSDEKEIEEAVITTSNTEQNSADFLENPKQTSTGNDVSTNATPEHSLIDRDSTTIINSDVAPNDDTPITVAEQQSDLNASEVASNPNEVSNFKQSIDSFAEQLQDIGSGVSKTAADLVNKVEERLSSEVAQNSPNYPHISNDNSMEAEQSTEQPEQPEQPSKHIPTFKETVDSFIAEVLDIGSNLNLMNKAERKEQVAGADQKQEQPEEHEATSTESSLAGTEKPESILNSSSTAENKSEIEQNFEHLIGSASEFSNNFGKPVESLWSVNGIEQENVAEQKADTVESAVSEKTHEPSPTIQTLVEDTRNGKDVNLQHLNAKLDNSEDAIPTLIAEENSSSFAAMESKNLNQEVDNDSSSHDLTSTSQSSVEVESVTNSLENSHQIETVPAIQEPIPTTVRPLEIESTSASEIQSISPNQEVENVTRYPELSSSNHDSEHTLSNSGLGVLKTEPHLAHYEEIIPVAVVSSSTEEERIINSNLTEQTESIKPAGDEQQNVKPSEQTENLSEVYHDSSFPDIQTPDSKQKLLESDPFFRPSSNENVDSHSNGIQDFNVHPITPQEITYPNESTTAATSEESTTSTLNNLEATTNAFNKFENTLKTLIGEEKLHEEENAATNLENSQLETSTTNPLKKEQEILATSSTAAAADETTILPKKFEEELQMAVKALEQTTHQQFEEFQNNLKEAFKKFTVFGSVEHEKSAESTTTQAPPESTFSIIKEIANETVEETTAKSLDIVMEEPRSGAIHQEFIDTFDENPSTTEVSKEREQNFEVSTSFVELPAVKHEALTLTNNLESETKELTTTESSVVVTTLTPAVENEEKHVQQAKDVTTAQPEETSFSTNVKEDLTAADGELEHNTTEAEESATEVATTLPGLESESLQEHVNHDVHNQLGEYNSDVVRTETQEQEQLTTEESLKQEMVEENHRELTQTDQPMVMVDGDITTTTATPETTTIEQEMVKFVKHTGGTYNGTSTEATAKQYKNEELDSTLATLQTQLPLTQPSFMAEQQQQIESTTVHTAQTHTVEDTTTNDTVAADTTEAVIYTTTVNEEDQEIETTTTLQELLDETTILPIETVEAEARSLSLKPPKLEYLQSVDGVEVFYGYSIVKHN
ncbi:hypothetical protein DOY81_007257 [Sarcophaga bullata]|nr:hypothetical protein DOY81_007257 [Sarcophaga bullata]